MDFNKVTKRIIGGAIEVHRTLGPGLLESTYESCLQCELVSRGLHVQRQQSLPVSYKGLQIACAYRLDLLVEGAVIVELKTVARIEPIHEAQLLSYLRLSGYPVGLLVNFNVKHLKSGIRRFVHETFREPSVPSVSSVVDEGL
jgi:GxxExxY protein